MSARTESCFTGNLNLVDVADNLASNLHLPEPLIHRRDIHSFSSPHLRCLISCTDASGPAV